MIKSVLSNWGLGINATKCLYEGVPTALYGAEASSKEVQREGN